MREKVIAEEKAKAAVLKLLMEKDEQRKIDERLEMEKALKLAAQKAEAVFKAKAEAEARIRAEKLAKATARIRAEKLAKFKA